MSIGGCYGGFECVVDGYKVCRIEFIRLGFVRGVAEHVSLFLFLGLEFPFVRMLEELGFVNM